MKTGENDVEVRGYMKVGTASDVCHSNRVGQSWYVITREWAREIRQVHYNSGTHRYPVVFQGA